MTRWNSTRYSPASRPLSISRTWLPSTDRWILNTVADHLRSSTGASSAPGPCPEKTQQIRWSELSCLREFAKFREREADRFAKIRGWGATAVHPSAPSLRCRGRPGVGVARRDGLVTEAGISRPGSTSRTVSDEVWTETPTRHVFPVPAGG